MENNPCLLGLVLALVGISIYGAIFFFLRLLRRNLDWYRRKFTIPSEAELDELVQLFREPDFPKYKIEGLLNKYGPNIPATILRDICTRKERTAVYPSYTYQDDMGVNIRVRAREETKRDVDQEIRRLANQYLQMYGLLENLGLESVGVEVNARVDEKAVKLLGCFLFLLLVASSLGSIYHLFLKQR